MHLATREGFLMKMVSMIPALALPLALGAATAVYAQQPVERWPEARANAWFAQQPWLVGANYIPSNAINELQMFQAATFDPAINDHELGLAESIGMNTVRVFLQDQLWQQDSEGFKRRLNMFLEIAAKHHIRPLLVLFDSCWETDPLLGPQHPPIPGVHNSGWVQSPGKARLMNPAVEPELKAYVVGVVGAFASDPRILGWDIWNEPDNRGGDKEEDVGAKVKRVDELLPKAFGWARSAHPTQPLTSGVWTGNWSDPSKQSETTKIQLSQSDVISFHNYDWPEGFTARIEELMQLHRPLLCTEYMARGAGSTFDGSLPIAKKYHVAAINWGLVAGLTQTYLPWDSWQRPYVLIQPTIWFHEVFRQDGTPYRQREVDLIKQQTGRGAVTPGQASLTEGQSAK
jgi:hypothetical protein